MTSEEKVQSLLGKEIEVRDRECDLIGVLSQEGEQFILNTSNKFFSCKFKINDVVDFRPELDEEMGYIRLNK